MKLKSFKVNYRDLDGLPVDNGPVFMASNKTAAKSMFSGYCYENKIAAAADIEVYEVEGASNENQK